MKPFQILCLPFITLCLFFEPNYAQSAPNIITFDKQPGEFVIVKVKDSQSQSSLKGTQNVLMRTLQTGYLAYDGLDFVFELRTQRDNPALNEKITTLRSKCQVSLEEDFRQNFELYGGGSSTRGAWEKNQELFDFVVTWKLDVYESEKKGLNSPLKLIMDETWEIYKTSNPSLKQKWEIYYPLQTDYSAIHSDVITLKAQEMLIDVIEPKRGPILKNICAFIHDHFNPEASRISK